MDDTKNMSNNTNQARRRRTRQTDIGTVPAPYETIQEVATAWHATLKISYEGETTTIVIPADEDKAP
jgi:hypothetical protein